MEICTTLVTYEDGKKKIIYERDPVTISYGVATISYPVLTTEEIQKIEATVYNKVQDLLSKY